MCRIVGWYVWWVYHELVLWDNRQAFVHTPVASWDNLPLRTELAQSYHPGRWKGGLHPKYLVIFGLLNMSYLYLLWVMKSCNMEPPPEHWFSACCIETGFCGSFVINDCHHARISGTLQPDACKRRTARVGNGDRIWLRTGIKERLRYRLLIHEVWVPELPISEYKKRFHCTLFAVHGQHSLACFSQSSEFLCQVLTQPWAPACD